MIHSWSMRRLHHCSPKTVAGGVLDCSASLASCFFLQFDWGVSGFGGSSINPKLEILTGVLSPLPTWFVSGSVLNIPPEPLLCRRPHVVMVTAKITKITSYGGEILILNHKSLHVGDWFTLVAEISFLHFLLKSSYIDKLIWHNSTCSTFCHI